MASAPTGHTPVLPEQVAALLAVRPGDTVVDATVGLGGHARLLVDGLCRGGSHQGGGTFVGLDADPAQLDAVRDALVAHAARVGARSGGACRIETAHANFTELPTVLARLGIAQVDVLLVDLGVSSAQLADDARGFSFQHDGPLDMRLDPRLTVTAADLVNRLKERALGDLLFFNAQERAGRKIAKRICRARRDGRITTTGQLVRIVSAATHVDPASRRSRIHPATRTFMALRIAVNDEIGALERLLASAPGLLAPGGRFGVIAFHSVEDKPVKVDFRNRQRDGIYQILTKRPVVADETERRLNPRARSAKLRVAVRLPA